MTLKLNPSRVGVGIAVFALGIVLHTASAAAQSARELVGAWILVASTADQGGNRTEPFGPAPKGMLMLSDNGWYTSLTMRSDLPKFASNNRMTGTAEENKAVVQGSNAHYGRYSVEGSSLVFRPEAALFPNWAGIEQRRTFALSGEELKVTVAAGSGGGVVELVYRRAK